MCTCCQRCIFFERPLKGPALSGDMSSTRSALVNRSAPSTPQQPHQGACNALHNRCPGASPPHSSCLLILSVASWYQRLVQAQAARRGRPSASQDQVLELLPLASVVKEPPLCLPCKGETADLSFVCTRHCLWHL